MNTKTSILVTGGAGYIGSNSVSKLIESGFNVVIVDDLSTGFKDLLHPAAKFYPLNIINTNELAHVMRTENVVGVIHFAAKIVVPESISEPLKSWDNFQKVSIIDGIITWPTGYDISPDYLLELAG